MTIDEFHAQCIKLLDAARDEWSDETWEALEDSYTMDILDSMMDLESLLEGNE